MNEIERKLSVAKVKLEEHVQDAEDQEDVFWRIDKISTISNKKRGIMLQDIKLLTLI
jgi:hypothetical protein